MLLLLQLLSDIFVVTEGVDVALTVATVAPTAVAVAVAATVANLPVAVTIITSYIRYCYQVSL